MWSGKGREQVLPDDAESFDNLSAEVV